MKRILKNLISIFGLFLFIFSCTRKDKYYNLSNEKLINLWSFYKIGDTLTLKNQDNQLIKLQVEEKVRDYDGKGGNGFIHRFETAYLSFKIISPIAMQDQHLLISFHADMGGGKDDIILLFYQENKNGELIQRKPTTIYFEEFDSRFVEQSSSDWYTKESANNTQPYEVEKINFSGKEYSQLQLITFVGTNDYQLAPINARAFYFNEKGILRFQIKANEYWEIAK